MHIQSIWNTFERITSCKFINLDFESSRNRYPCRIVVRIGNMRVLAVGHWQTWIPESNEHARVVIKLGEAKLKAQDEIAKGLPCIIEQPKIAPRLGNNRTVYQ